MRSKSLVYAAACTAISIGAGLLASYAHSHELTGASRTERPAQAMAPRAHVRSEFQFTIHASKDVAAALFGPEAERGWAGESWNPRFLYPQPARDVEGAVLAVQHGDQRSTWVVASLDFAAGRVQYVYVVDGAMATRIDIRLAATGPQETAVSVAYERTALAPEADEHVRALAQDDAKSGPHWESTINEYLKAKAHPKQ